jgi:hypothetical protein
MALDLLPVYQPIKTRENLKPTGGHVNALRPIPTDLQEYINHFTILVNSRA